MATKWISPTWRMPDEQNQSKFDNYSLNFDGNEYVIIGSSTDIDNAPSNPYSFSFWFKSSTAGRVLSEKKASATGFFNAQYAIHLESGKITWYGGAGDSNNGRPATYTSTTLTDDKWHHIVCVAESTTVNKIYVDGQLDVTSSVNRINSAVVAGTFNIGANYGGSYGFIGQLSQYCIFDYALSQNQVNYLYNSNTPQNPIAISGSAPIAYYPLGGSSTGSASTLTTPNESVPSATVFDFTGGSGEYISTNSTGLLNGENEASFSFWIKAKSGVANYDGLICQRSSGGAYLLIHVGDISGSDYRIYIQQNNGATYTMTYTPRNLVIDTWYHVCAKGSVGGKWDIYTNNSLNNDEQTANNIAAIVQDSALKIGQDTSGRDLVGEMSNVQIWNKNLSTANITTLYNNGVPLYTGTQPQAANLRAWYPMNVVNANWAADTASDWQIADAVSAYSQGFNFPNVGGNNANGIEVVNPPRPQSEITVSKWINPSSTQLAYAHTLVTNGSGGGGTIAYGFYFQPASQYNFWIYVVNGGVGSNGASHTINVPKDQWSHIVGTYDGSNIKIYLNGAQQGADVAKTGDLSYDTSSSLFIGREVRTSPTNHWSYNGEISNVMIFDTALPATGTDSVETLYNNGVPLTSAIATSNLKAWYKLDKSKDLFSGNLPDTMFLPNDYKQNFTKALKIADTAGKSINLASSLDLGTEHTISYWLISPASWGTRAGSISTDGSQNRIYISNSTAYYRASGGTEVFDSNMGWGWYGQAGVWYNFVITRKDGNVNFYNNGSVTSSSPHSFTASENFSLKDFLGHSSQWGETIISNIAILDKELSSSEVATMYNNGNPIYNLSDIPQSSNVKLWWKLNTDPSSNIVDSSGNNQTGVTSNYVSSDLKNIAVGSNSGKTSNMTEQNLVNNNVSALNGASSGMTTANLVNSDLTRSIPYSSYSMVFDATNDFVNCGNNSSLDITSNISISAWIKAGSSGWVASFPLFATKGSNVSYMLFGRKVSSTSLLPRLRIGVNGDPNMVEATTSLNSTDWYHILGTFDGSTMKIYINGQLDNSKSLSQSIPTGSDNFTIGGTSGGGTSGQISNVAIWNSTLTQDQILTIYNGGFPNDISNLSPVSWWSLSSDSYYGSNWICPDLGSATNNGTGNNLPTTALIGNGPGSTANGTATSMNIPENLKGNAPNSSKNAFSINMTETDRETSVPS